jgi:hypothetical protein
VISTPNQSAVIAKSNAFSISLREPRRTSLERDAKQDRSQTSETKGDNRLNRPDCPVTERARGSCAASSSRGRRMGVIRMIVVFRGGSSTGGGGRGRGNGRVGSEGIVRSTGLVRWDLRSVDEDEVGTLEEISISLLDAGIQGSCILISDLFLNRSYSRGQAYSPRCIEPE